MGRFPTPLNRPARFVLALILLPVLFYVGSWTGYKAGFSAGYSSASAQPEDAEYAERTYPVGDLVLSFHPTQGTYYADYNSLSNLITNVIPAGWQMYGGSATILAQPEARRLVISQTNFNHRKIANLLKELRVSRQPVVRIGLAEASDPANVPHGVVE